MLSNLVEKSDSAQNVPYLPDLIRVSAALNIISLLDGTPFHHILTPNPLNYRNPFI